jgi:hypothetical protein
LAELTTDIVDAFRPRAGYTFRRGVVLTHNCNWEHVTDTIAPALAGCEDRNSLVRRRAAQATPGMRLVVVADGREAAGGPGHPWARLVRVGGRRQHAKVGLLEYVSAQGHRMVRAYVASANLTPSGTSSNRELIVVDEQGAGAAGKSLVADVAAMLTTSVKRLEVPEPHRRELRSVLGPITKGLKATRTGALVHSLDQERELLGALGKPAAAERIVIVSPAFAADTDKGAATALSPWIEEGATSVEVITQAGTDGVMRFSQAARDELRELAGSDKVAVYKVPLEPEDHDDKQAPVDADAEPGGVRRLHAKLVAAVKGGDARLLVGSANFSTPGLLGRNREAVVALAMPTGEFDRLLGELPRSRHKGPIGLATAATWEGSSPAPVVVAVFECDPLLHPDPANLVGCLRLDTGGLDVVRVLYDGTELTAWQDHPIAIRADTAVITVVVAHHGEELTVEVPIELRLDDDQLQHWPTQDRTEPLSDLERLLGTIRVTATSSRDPKEPGDPKRTGTADDKFVIPLEQRLVLLARYRAQVAPLFRAYWHSDRRRLSGLLEADELRLATALFGLDDEAPSELLGSLAGAADALHELRGQQ